MLEITYRTRGAGDRLAIDSPHNPAEETITVAPSSRRHLQ